MLNTYFLFIFLLSINCKGALYNCLLDKCSNGGTCDLTDVATFTSLNPTDHEHNNGPCRVDVDGGDGTESNGDFTYYNLNFIECQALCAKDNACLAFEAKHNHEDLYNHCEIWYIVPKSARVDRDTYSCNVKNSPSIYSCNCLDGFEGEQCEINKDDCQTNTCENNSVCQDQVNGFDCFGEYRCTPKNPGLTPLKCEEKCFVSETGIETKHPTCRYEKSTSLETNHQCDCTSVSDSALIVTTPAMEISTKTCSISYVLNWSWAHYNMLNKSEKKMLESSIAQKTAQTGGFVTSFIKQVVLTKTNAISKNERRSDDGVQEQIEADCVLLLPAKSEVEGGDDQILRDFEADTLTRWTTAINFAKEVGDLVFTTDGINEITPETIALGEVVVNTKEKPVCEDGFYLKVSENKNESEAKCHQCNTECASCIDDYACTSCVNDKAVGLFCVQEFNADSDDNDSSNTIVIIGAAIGAFVVITMCTGIASKVYYMRKDECKKKEIRQANETGLKEIQIMINQSNDICSDALAKTTNDDLLNVT
eukprot:Awhi_evm1s14675